MQPYQTQNFALALMLATCGVPFYKKDGFFPVINTYSAAILRRKYDQRYRGMPLEDAVRKAVEDGNPGAVTYCFESTPELERLITAYNEQVKAIEKGEGGAELANIEPEEAARLCAQLAANRKHFRNFWKTAKPLIAVQGESKTVSEGQRTVTKGSMKLYSLDASPETRSKLKV